MSIGKLQPLLQGGDSLRWEGGFLQNGVLPLRKRFLRFYQFNVPRIVIGVQLLRSSRQSVQRSRLNPPQRRCQHPIGVAIRFHANQGFAPYNQTVCHVCQALLWIFHGAGHDKPVFRPGHGDVQNPEFLTDTLPLDGIGNGKLRNGTVANAVLVICHCQPQSQILVAQHLLLSVAGIKAVGQAAEKHDRKLQPL